MAYNELAVIVERGFAGYFLMVADFMGWARERGIPTGPGWGAAAGSLALYALGVIDVDPLRFDLLFERFINPGFRSLPPIVTDLCSERREEVIDYLTGTYGGEEQVARIIAFSRLSARDSLKVAGRALGLPRATTAPLEKLAPNKWSEWSVPPLEYLMVSKPKLRRGAAAHPQLFQFALLLEGAPVSAGLEPTGLVIGDKPLMESLPLCRLRAEDRLIAQFDCRDVEELGLIKFDFSARIDLTIIDRCLKSLPGGGPDFQTLGYEDGPTWALLGRGDSGGVFEFGNTDMRGYLTRLKPSRLEDLMALLALYRPWQPLNGPLTDEFITRKHKRGEAGAPFGLARLEPILRETYGLIIYQEQFMRLGQAVAGFSLSRANELRKAMGKRNAAKVAAHKADFLSGAEANGLEAGTAEAIFHEMTKSAEYIANKSHAAAYAVTAYRTAYLKANCPEEFMAAQKASKLLIRDLLF